MKHFTFLAFLLSLSYNMHAQCSSVNNAALLKSCLESAPHNATLSASFDITGTTITIPNATIATLSLGGFNLTWTGSPWAIATGNAKLQINNGVSGFSVVKTNPGGGEIDIAAFNAMGSMSAALPVELVDFSAKLTAGKQPVVNIRLTTENEVNNDYFIIERSQDGLSFEAIGTIEGTGTVGTRQTYTFDDHSPLPGKSYYRIQLIDLDGKVNFSTVNVVINMTISVSISPVPAKDLMTLVLAEASTETTSWEVVNTDGRVMLSGIFEENETQSSVNISTLNTGCYFVRILGSQNLVTKQVIKQ